MPIYVPGVTPGLFNFKNFAHFFARFSLPEITVSDYGTAFTRAEFKEFVERNGMCHLRTVPYHAASNGFALRAVQTLKRSLLKQTQGI